MTFVLPATRRIGLLLLIVFLVLGLVRILLKSKAAAVVVLVLLCLGLVGGLGFLAWENRDELASLSREALGPTDSEDDVSPREASIAAPTDGREPVLEPDHDETAPPAAGPYVHPSLSFSFQPPHDWEVDTFWAGVHITSTTGSVFIAHEKSAEPSEMMEAMRRDLGREMGSAPLQVERTVAGEVVTGFVLETEEFTTQVHFLPSEDGVYVLGAEFPSSTPPERRVVLDQILESFRMPDGS